MKEDEIGGACGTHEYRIGEGNVWQENLKERDYLEDAGVDESIIIY
jgi:hypothetical protein